MGAASSLLNILLVLFCSSLMSLYEVRNNEHMYLLVCALLCTACTNYCLVGPHTLPVLDLVCAVGLVLFSHELIPVRVVGLTLLGVRFLDSVGCLATQDAISPVVRFGLVVVQVVVCFFCSPKSRR